MLSCVRQVIQMKCKDGRIKLMNELLNGIKVCLTCFCMRCSVHYARITSPRFHGNPTKAVFAEEL